MNTYIGFLRGINVGGQKKIKMADLRESLEKAGFKSVQTYIQSGNLVFMDKSSERQVVAKNIEQILLKDFGFEVPVLVTTAQQLKKILEENPFSNDAEQKNLYFALLHEAPDENEKANLKPADYPNETFHMAEDCVYLNCKKGAGKAKLTNNIIERKLKVTATTRNLRTMQKMVEMAS
ncbi:DUF1697 domain-containing protein [Allomuricauda sp. d1]|uniref:DUF1697 domain-containing protein n=1 Tax=Allomuricauda sp. d1 TaxID=3136725 RepID=UPI0031E4418B